jgi:monovalent cation/proton antiporter MnhG/PhaG subunit
MSEMGPFTWYAFFNLLSAAALLCGVFFMAVGALSLLRLQDCYARIHGASKCTTLGLTGMLVAVCIYIADPATVSKALITIVFTFVANPIGSHLLAKAAHHAGAGVSGTTVGDELAEDKLDPAYSVSDDNIGAPPSHVPEEAGNARQGSDRPARLGAA